MKHRNSYDCNLCAENVNRYLTRLIACILIAPMLVDPAFSAGLGALVPEPHAISGLTQQRLQEEALAVVAESGERTLRLFWKRISRTFESMVRSTELRALPENQNRHGWISPLQNFAARTRDRGYLFCLSPYFGPAVTTILITLNFAYLALAWMHGETFNASRAGANSPWMQSSLWPNLVVPPIQAPGFERHYRPQVPGFLQRQLPGWMKRGLPRFFQGVEKRIIVNITFETSQVGGMYQVMRDQTAAAKVGLARQDGTPAPAEELLMAPLFTVEKEFTVESPGEIRWKRFVRPQTIKDFPGYDGLQNLPAHPVDWEQYLASGPDGPRHRYPLNLKGVVAEDISFQMFGHGARDLTGEPVIGQKMVHARVWEAELHGAPALLIEHKPTEIEKRARVNYTGQIYDAPHNDEREYHRFLAEASIAALKALRIQPAILKGNDQTNLALAYVAWRPENQKYFRETALVATSHTPVAAGRAMITRKGMSDEAWHSYWRNNLGLPGYPWRGVLDEVEIGARAADVFVAVSRDNANALGRIYRYLASKIVGINNGMDHRVWLPGNFSFESIARECKARLGWNFDPAAPRRNDEIAQLGAILQDHRQENREKFALRVSELTGRPFDAGRFTIGRAARATTWKGITTVFDGVTLQQYQKEGIQVVYIGQGEPAVESQLKMLERLYPDVLYYIPVFDNKFAQLGYGGGFDVLAYPSLGNTEVPASLNEDESHEESVSGEASGTSHYMPVCPIIASFTAAMMDQGENQGYYLLPRGCPNDKLAAAFHDEANKIHQFWRAPDQQQWRILLARKYLAILNRFDAGITEFQYMRDAYLPALNRAAEVRYLDSRPTLGQELVLRPGESVTWRIRMAAGHIFDPWLRLSFRPETPEAQVVDVEESEEHARKKGFWDVSFHPVNAEGPDTEYQCTFKVPNEVGVYSANPYTRRPGSDEGGEQTWWPSIPGMQVTLKVQPPNPYRIVSRLLEAADDWEQLESMILSLGQVDAADALRDFGSTGQSLVMRAIAILAPDRLADLRRWNESEYRRLELRSHEPEFIRHFAFEFLTMTAQNHQENALSLPARIKIAEMLQKAGAEKLITSENNPTEDGVILVFPVPEHAGTCIVIPLALTPPDAFSAANGGMRSITISGTGPEGEINRQRLRAEDIGHIRVHDEGLGVHYAPVPMDRLSGNRWNFLIPENAGFQVLVTRYSPPPPNPPVARAADLTRAGA